MDTRSALRTALVRGSAFTLVTAAYLLIGGTLGGYLWCVYVGFFLTMAFGAKGEDLPRYLCSFLAGYVWAAVYVYLPELLGGFIPGAAATVVSEFVVTAGLLFLHLRFLSGTWLGKIPAVFAAVATVFASGGLQNAPPAALSGCIGILMACGTGWIIARLERSGRAKG